MYRDPLALLCYYLTCMHLQPRLCMHLQMLSLVSAAGHTAAAADDPAAYQARVAASVCPY